MSTDTNSSEFWGVDVAKAELVMARHRQSSTLTVANEAVAIAAWLAQIAPGSVIAMESTGR